MVSSRVARGSIQCVSQPCWLTRTVGRNARTSGGTTAWNARSQPASLVPAGSATLTADPFAPRPSGLGDVAGAVGGDGEGAGGQVVDVGELSGGEGRDGDQRLGAAREPGAQQTVER